MSGRKREPTFADALKWLLAQGHIMGSGHESPTGLGIAEAMVEALQLPQNVMEIASGAHPWPVGEMTTGPESDGHMYHYTPEPPAERTPPLEEQCVTAASVTNSVVPPAIGSTFDTTTSPARIWRREPHPGETETPLFEAIWRVVKNWEIQTPNGSWYSCTGNDVCGIIDSIAAQPPAERTPPDDVIELARTLYGIAHRRMNRKYKIRDMASALKSVPFRLHEDSVEIACCLFNKRLLSGETPDDAADLIEDFMRAEFPESQPPAERTPPRITPQMMSEAFAASVNNRDPEHGHLYDHRIAAEFLNKQLADRQPVSASNTFTVDAEGNSPYIAPASAKPDAGVEVNSRSQQKRIAALKGEPMPTFKPDAPKE